MVSSFLIALSLSMDNLTVTVAAGTGAAHLINRRLVYEIACLFAAAHFLMFSLGFWGGEHIAPVLGKVAPWIASGALVYIGLGMLWQACHKPAEVNHVIFSSLKNKMLLALATSVDAFLVGTSFGFTRSDYWQMVFMLAVCVWITSAAGFKMGHLLGKKFGRRIEAVGGITLVVLGVKLLLEMQGIL